MRKTLTNGLVPDSRPEEDPRLPLPFAIGAGLLLVITAAALSGLLDLDTTAAFLATLSVVAVLAWWCTIPAAPIIAVVAFLTFDGFVLGGPGDLTWDGLPDTTRLLLLLLVAFVVAAERSTAVEWARRRS